MFHTQTTMVGLMYGVGQKQNLSALAETKAKNTKMGLWYVKNVVEFYGEVEADSREEAEEKGYYYDNLQYGGVYSVDVNELVSNEDYESEEDAD